MPVHCLQFSSPRQLFGLLGEDDSRIKALENTFAVSLSTEGDCLTIEGKQAHIQKVLEVLELLGLARSQGLNIHASDFSHITQAVAQNKGSQFKALFQNPILIKLKNASIIPKTLSQKHYLEAIHKHVIVFGLGPAGTGKTYLAVATALQALFENRVDRILITRPAVEAGEALGFLPGDLKEKILPYLRPIYDALYEMIGQDYTQKLIERGIIEIAPLAYMRGRTLSRAFILLDEAQNATDKQMMMFLTRLGDHSRMIITGDLSQPDLPSHKTSGLKQALDILHTVEGIGMFHFQARDVVRHPLVQAIIEAYDNAIKC